MQSPNLPDSPVLNIAAFANLFARTSASYKFLWMQAILRVVERNDTSRPIPIALLAAHMFDIAKYPLRRFLLSLGWQDRVEEALRNLEDAEGWHYLRTEMLSRDIAERYADIPEFIFSQITALVPYRLLTPFYSGELAGLGQAATNRKIANLAEMNFKTKNPPPYRFVADDTAIELHPAWCDYFLSNGEILEGWVKWHWVNYLQKCNPNTPAISRKLEKPDQRNTMKKQTEFWRWAIGARAGEIRCIYSKEVLQVGNFSLDHFVPWDFISHDFLWNLIPVKKEINSAKGNSLPDDSYLPEFVEMQYIALSAFHLRRRDRWDNLMESYLGDLRVTMDRESAPDFDRLLAAYRRVMPPLLQLAENCGFRRWEYRR